MQEITVPQLEDSLRKWLENYHGLRRVLLLPPDITRYYSRAGLIVQLLYKMLAPECRVDIMPALGTHLPVNESERLKMFGDIPAGNFFVHDWRNDTVKIGTVPEGYVAEVSDGLVRYPIPVMVNRRLLEREYDLIVSIGQVVPHEVVGMANFTKNILIGCGGKEFIDKSHFLGAAYGMERLMGRDHSPVRKVFDYAENNFLQGLPLQYMLTVLSTGGALCGFFAGRSRQLFEAAVDLSRRENLTMLDRPLNRVVVYLEPEEFKSTWLGNKAVYRTRMAIADDGELLVIAPGLRQFGEDREIDGLIRKYGYVGSKRVLELVDSTADLGGNLSAAAHLIHGSSEGRFSITYAPGHLTEAELKQANLGYLPLEEAIRRYRPEQLQNGMNRLADGTEFFYISNPALGLWALRKNFE